MVSIPQTGSTVVPGAGLGAGRRQSAAVISDRSGTEQVMPLRRLLDREGFQVDVLSATDLFSNGAVCTSYDVAVLDVARFDGLGLHACKRLRSPNKYLPIMVLCEDNNVADRIRGFECGVDDFIGKPYSARELSARLRSLMRRNGAVSPQHVLRYGDLTVDLASRVAYRGDRYIDLSRREFALVSYLMRNAERAISRTEFLQQVWANATNQERSNVVDVYINYVRNKIEQGGREHRVIHTVRGRGYMLHHQSTA